MSMTEIVKVFGERKIRSVWDDAAEEWYFSVVDVVAVLTESAGETPPPRSRCVFW